MTEPIEIRQLTLDDLRLIGEIDRSERQHVQYSVVDGQLQSNPFEFDVPAWDPVGDGFHSIGSMIAFAGPIVERGAAFLGAFVGSDFAGLVIVEHHHEREMAWLALLHVDRSHRRGGVASLLWEAAMNRARASGATGMYVSATPSDSAVGFYLSRGCRLAARSELNDQLYAHEPDDIHMICELR